MSAAGTAPRCKWCAATQTMIARQAYMIKSLMDEVDDLNTRNADLNAARQELADRNTRLMSDNRRLRLALGHPRPALAVVQPADREA